MQRLYDVLRNTTIFFSSQNKEIQGEKTYWKSEPIDSALPGVGGF